MKPQSPGLAPSVTIVIPTHRGRKEEVTVLGVRSRLTEGRPTARMVAAMTLYGLGVQSPCHSPLAAACAVASVHCPTLYRLLLLSAA